MTDDILTRLDEFRRIHEIKTQGPLSCVLFITNKALRRGLPLSVADEDLLTPNKGQVSGLGGGAIKRILKTHSINRKLASEGGRTSRGNIGLARDYGLFINSLGLAPAQLSEVEKWWVDRIVDLWNTTPLEVNFDMSNTISALVGSMLAAAKHRQRQLTGRMIEGTVLQHLIGAKLALRFPNRVITHNKASTADRAADRSGDFHIGNTVIHVTIAPNEDMVGKCVDNLRRSLRPIIISPSNRIAAARQLVANADVENRVETYSAEEYVSSNLNELAEFDEEQTKETAKKLIGKYNEIVLAIEGDSSLEFNIGRKGKPKKSRTEH